MRQWGLEGRNSRENVEKNLPENFMKRSQKFVQKFLEKVNGLIATPLYKIDLFLQSKLCLLDPPDFHLIW